MITCPITVVVDTPKSSRKCVSNNFTFEDEEDNDKIDAMQDEKRQPQHDDDNNNSYSLP